MDSIRNVTLAGHGGPRPARPGDLHLVMAIGYGDGERRLYRQRIPGRVDRDSLALTLSHPAGRLPFGLLKMHLRLVEAGGDSVSLNPPREFVSLNLPLGDDDVWRRHVGWLEGREGDRDLGEMKETPRAERSGAWRDFWAGAGGAPARREHLLRILEADRRFGDFGRGALSDMGRTWIRHGAPDRIETREVDISSPGAWQVWYYYSLGYSYVFYDAYGVGDYRLYSTAPF